MGQTPLMLIKLTLIIGTVFIAVMRLAHAGDEVECPPYSEARKDPGPGYGFYSPCRWNRIGVSMCVEWCTDQHGDVYEKECHDTKAWAWHEYHDSTRRSYTVHPGRDGNKVTQEYCYRRAGNKLGACVSGCLTADPTKPYAYKWPHTSESGPHYTGPEKSFIPGNLR